MASMLWIVPRERPDVMIQKKFTWQRRGSNVASPSKNHDQICKFFVDFTTFIQEGKCRMKTWSWPLLITRNGSSGLGRKDYADAGQHFRSDENNGKDAVFLPISRVLTPDEIRLSKNILTRRGGVQEERVKEKERCRIEFWEETFGGMKLTYMIFHLLLP